jgi:hypothetical protein
MIVLIVLLMLKWCWRIIYYSVVIIRRKWHLTHHLRIIWIIKHVIWICIISHLLCISQVVHIVLYLISEKLVIVLVVVIAILLHRIRVFDLGHRIKLRMIVHQMIMLSYILLWLLLLSNCACNCTYKNIKRYIVVLETGFADEVEPLPGC